MKFLHLVPRRVQAVRTAANEEEEEEGRQGLLPLSCHNEQSSAPIPATNMACHASKPQTQPPVSFHTTSTVPLSFMIKHEQTVYCTNSQTVVLKAPLHCQGCARRVKKTLSKLEGVNTYHVDTELQKVTVIGNVCSDNVLQSVNKVIKGAQLWAAPTSPQLSS